MWILGDFDERLDHLADQFSHGTSGDAAAIAAPARLRTQAILGVYSSYLFLWATLAVAALLLIVR